MDTLIKLIADYGTWAIFLVILLEYACFPVSSEIILPFSGAIASVNNIPFFPLIITSILAGIIGTLICYAIGRLGGEALIKKIIKRFPKTEKGLNSSMQKFNRFGGPAVCMARIIPLCRTYIAFVAGAAKQSLAQYVIFSLIGISAWNTLLIGLGYYFRENWHLVAAYYSKYKAGIIPILMIAVLLIVAKLLSKRRTVAETQNN